MPGQRSAAKTANFLLERTIEEFARASSLIESIEDRIYTQGLETRGSIGAHIRHNFDIAGSFLSGLQTGKIDYTQRKRNPRIEQDRQYATTRIRDLVAVLQCIPEEILNRRAVVRSEIDDDVWHNSSVMRELEFVHSHTVHHHAVVAEKLKAFGVEVSDGFGAAPSTLKFWTERDRLQVTNSSIAGAAII
jgi:hypothetical protein